MSGSKLPVARILGGRRPFLYTLGQQGVVYVETRMRTTALPVQPRTLDRLDHVCIDHDLKAVALWADLKAQLCNCRGSRWLWIGRTRAHRPSECTSARPQTDSWLPFLPDAYFELIYPNGDVQCVLVEIEVGTQTLRNFGRKMLAFELALDDGVFRRHFNANSSRPWCRRSRNAASRRCATWCRTIAAASTT